jgi:uncharacterized heparinase superfamily protein
MARLDLAYATALFRAAPTAAVARALARRLRRTLDRAPSPPRLDYAAVAAAADALGRAPRIFTSEPLHDLYAIHFPEGRARLWRRAEQILTHRIDVFGVNLNLGSKIDWQRDPLTGRVFDPEARELFPDGIDPKAAWELARAAHLIELGAAARLFPSLRAPARAEIVAELDSFMTATVVGRGIHYASPLELAMRAIHWLGAVELVGGAPALPRPFVERLAARLLADGHFLATHLEDTGVVPANHLLGDYVGLWALGLALDGAPGAGCWQKVARQGIAQQAARQVGSDGAHFEAATAYHRFALELLLVAHLYARAADRELDVAETLHRMFLFVRGYLGPDGDEPAFGDGDDARLLPLVPRPPRQHHYLLSIGAALFADPELRPVAGTLAEEALWLCGARALAVWRWLPPTPAPPSLSFLSGGVHVLRDARWQVALRAGSYGQNGVGGHAHNDQLSLVAWLDGRPLVVDPGTARYAADMVLRDCFRGTAAHSTLTLDGAEQSPLLDGRPFALLDRAHGRRITLEDTGDRASIVAEHDGYRRLPCRARHRRTVTLLRDRGVIVISDELSGRGTAAAAVHFQLLEPARLGLGEQARTRLAGLSELGPFDFEHGFEIGSPARALLVPCLPDALQATVSLGNFSPRYGLTEARPLVTFRRRLTFPAFQRYVLLWLRG